MSQSFWDGTGRETAHAIQVVEVELTDLLVDLQAVGPSGADEHRLLRGEVKLLGQQLAQLAASITE